MAVVASSVNKSLKNEYGSAQQVPRLSEANSRRNGSPAAHAVGEVLPAAQIFRFAGCVALISLPPPPTTLTQWPTIHEVVVSLPEVGQAAVNSSEYGSLDGIAGALYTLMATNTAMAVTGLILGLKSQPEISFQE
ncbi:hypothetical protein B0H14DRAFT_2582844 [Mycena olivaceomarginata]|nr:hypothetical protein B0H14DRAFT_2582844 [Mycena olivaceomarginata]